MRKQIDQTIADSLKQAFPDATQDELEKMASESGGRVEAIMDCYNPDLLLEANQRRVVELTAEIGFFAQNTEGNRARRNQIQREIEQIEKAKGYRKPALIPVINSASHPVNIRGKSVEPNGAVEVYPWEWRALARFLEFRF